MTSNGRFCHYCATTEDELRPYGPNGTWTCFPCMKADPDRERIAELAYEAQIALAEAVSPVGVAAVGLSEGPIAYVPGGHDGE